MPRLTPRKIQNFSIYIFPCSSLIQNDEINVSHVRQSLSLHVLIFGDVRIMGWFKLRFHKCHSCLTHMERIPNLFQVHLDSNYLSSIGDNKFIYSTLTIFSYLAKVHGHSYGDIWSLCYSNLYFHKFHTCLKLHERKPPARTMSISIRSN